jgi:Rrf2 family iron-sulfur cluster assembly transcriptional regulator
VRGPGGGYCLGRDALEITVADVILAVDEPLDATQCGGRENCKSDHRCMTHDLWSTLNRKMLDYLASVTLSDLVEKQRKKVAAQAAKSDSKTVSFSVAQAA